VKEDHVVKRVVGRVKRRLGFGSGIGKRFAVWGLRQARRYGMNGKCNGSSGI
jgi:hypothetical protein